jgi:hypothetical protein
MHPLHFRRYRTNWKLGCTMPANPNKAADAREGASSMVNEELDYTIPSRPLVCARVLLSSAKGGFVPCEGGTHRMFGGEEAVSALPWKQVRQIVDRFESLNPYDPKIVPGSVLNIVEELNYASNGCQRQLYGYGISAKRYGLYTRDEFDFHLIKVSEHGLGLYYRPKEGRDEECEVPMWIKEGWEWIAVLLMSA